MHEVVSEHGRQERPCPQDGTAFSRPDELLLPTGYSDQVRFLAPALAESLEWSCEVHIFVPRVDQHSKYVTHSTNNRVHSEGSAGSGKRELGLQTLAFPPRPSRSTAAEVEVA